ncbi:MAG: TerC/Alx family metal homeostasis membrane protein [Oligoflexia bacterium]|nr:TerC/Alx family metal homeostasis membrane protein [Oligoflexia bacterium]
MIILWISFIVLIIALLVLDLGVFNKKNHVIGIKEALLWTVFWVVLSLIFNAAVYYIYKHHWFGIGMDVEARQAALHFFTGYIIEKSLSLDNIFVIAVIFTYFRVPNIYQHRVLFYGILGAIVMRGIMIVLGTALVSRFTWVMYVFGVFLLFTAVRMLFDKHDKVEPDKNFLIRLARRIYPVTGDYASEHFFTRLADGRKAVTPLFIALLMVESSDVLFAVDSIPAIFAITTDAFIVFTSNIFAILGLRSLFFALAGIMDRFRHLKYGLSVILAYIGIKMIIAHYYQIPALVTLIVIAGVLLVSMLVSLEVKIDPMHVVDELVDDIEALIKLSYRRARQLIILVFGISIFFIGVAMMLTPGPGFIVSALGLGILATEFIWARNLLLKLKKNVKQIAKTFKIDIFGKNG